MPNEIYHNRDILLRAKSDGNPLQRINECNKAYDSLQYPLLFPNGEDGWNVGLKLLNPSSNELTNNPMSVMQYCSYMMMQRDHFNPLLYARKLMQQFVVDQFEKMETTRLMYLRHNQQSLRCESYSLMF